MTRKYAVLGSPIEHSLSPKIHEFIFSRLSADASYERFDLASGLQDFLDSRPDFSGFSLTMPLKTQAFDIAVNHSSAAVATGSVNTLISTSLGWSGFNTDVYGIQAAIAKSPSKVAVIGSGATARSALHAFPKALKVIHARNTTAAQGLAKEFEALVVSFEDAIESEVVVSTLPAGELAKLISFEFRFQTLLDVAYTNPMFAAEHYVSGLEMLIQQAVVQQRIFAGQDETEALPNEVEILKALRTALNMAK